MQRRRSEWVSMKVTNMRDFARAREVADEVILAGDEPFRRRALRDVGIHPGGPLGRMVGMFRRDAMDPFDDFPGDGLGDHVRTLLRAVRITVKLVALLGFVYLMQTVMLWFLNAFWVHNPKAPFWPWVGYPHAGTAAVIAVVLIVVVTYLILRGFGSAPGIAREWMVTSRSEGRLVLRRMASEP